MLVRKLGFVIFLFCFIWGFPDLMT
jgi:hypothetical protein